MVDRVITEDLFTKHRIIDPTLPEGQQIHNFLLLRAKALAGRYVDFDKTPITFVLSDEDAPNAFFMRVTDPEKLPDRVRDETIRYPLNPLDTPIVCITRGLLEMVDNLDQLDFVLGHELTHYIMRTKNIERNSKGEEEIADLHSVDLMYDAGGDPKQADIISDKISAYAKEERARRRKRERKYGDNDKSDKTINWSEIFDVHMTDPNRKSGIEASLTRLSHLIDERTPSDIDKSKLTFYYTDPVDQFLDDNNYKDQKAVGKLKILIDCIDNIAGYEEPDQFVQRHIAAIPTDTEGNTTYELARHGAELLLAQKEGFPDYFKGKTIPKKYHQKLADLAEGIIAQVQVDRKEKGHQQKPAIVNTEDLMHYLYDAAYVHLNEHGYPAGNDINYPEATGVMYSYFLELCDDNNRRNDIRPSNEEEEEKLSRTRIGQDILAQHELIKAAQTAEEFLAAADELQRLDKLLSDIKASEYTKAIREDHSIKMDKFDNLTAINSWGDNYYPRRIYDDLKPGDTLPWNNLVEIAKENDEVKERVVKLLDANGIQDHRIIQDLPYVRISNYKSHMVNEDGTLGKPIPAYEMDYATKRELIEESYRYLQDYFDKEPEMTAQTCAAALSVTDDDFRKFANPTKSFDNTSVASNKFYDFVSLFNSLPEIKKETEEEKSNLEAEDTLADEEDDAEGEYTHDDIDEDTIEYEYEFDEEFDYFQDDPKEKSIIPLIPLNHLLADPIPGSSRPKNSFRDNMSFDYNANLLKFSNPIFRKRFGEEFHTELLERKQAQQEMMFETAFKLMDKNIDEWLIAKEHRDALQEASSKLRQSIWKLEEVEPKDEELIARKEAEQEKLDKDLEFWREKEDTTGSLIYNIFFSVFKSNLSRWNLQRLTEDQKSKLAEFAARDEKGAVRKLMDMSTYEHFCDYLHIREEQTNRVLEGNYQLTPMMQIVADNEDYTHADTKENLKAFVDSVEKGRYSREDKKYSWYLHVFDTMQYLQANADIDVNSLAIAIQRIKESEKSSNGADSYEIVEQRHLNYHNLVRNSSLPQLFIKAIDNHSNYEGLSCDELMATADNILEVREHFAKSFSRKSDYHYGKQDDKTTAEEHKILWMIDKNVRALLRKSEHQALQNENAYEKIAQLYRTYNGFTEYNNSSARNKYVKDIEGREGRGAHLTELAKEKDFWPKDALEHVKAFVFAKNTFIDDNEFEDQLLNDILEKVEQLPAGKKKNECLHILLDQKLRASFPETRERLFNIYVEDIHSKLGKDDTSENYKARLEIYLKALANEDEIKPDWDIGKNYGSRNGLLSGKIGAADKYVLLRQLSDRLITQEQTSKMMRDAIQIKLNSDDMMNSYLYGIGVDYLTEEMDRDAAFANEFIKFFNSAGEQADCEKLSDYIKDFYINKYGRNDTRTIKAIRNTPSSNCKILFENFWAAPIEGRAVVISRMLKSAAETEDADEKAQVCKADEQPWERSFNIVIDSLISPDDDRQEAKYARDIMHSYIKSRSEYERVLIMSAMMVANRNIGSDAGNIGKALKLFFENMGPAEIKLGQAIASHPDTPDGIKVELQELKNAADKPARWSLYEWIKLENIPEEYWKDKYIGEILGSASYYTTVELGEEHVLRLLRPEAREKAAKGFRVIRDTAADLKIKDASSELDYKELTTSVEEMIIQASKMASIETDHDKGEQQYHDATHIYNGVKLKSGGHTFTLKVMDWRVRGQNWIIMERAKGPTFNDMPQATAEQLHYKKSLAKAYIAFELQNILSGKKFDHDRHGAQLSINPKTNEVGIYDTGAMALNTPSATDQNILGEVIKDAISKINEGYDLSASFNEAVSAKIETLHSQNDDTKYLVEAKKGLLALGDFFNILDVQDIGQIMPSLDLANVLSEDIKVGILSNMTIFEKTSFGASSVFNLSSKSDIEIIRPEKPQQQVPVPVQQIMVAPDKRIKSTWLQDTFSDTEDPNDSDDETSIDPNSFHIVKVTTPTSHFAIR